MGGIEIDQSRLEVHILSNTPSSKPGGLQKSSETRSGSVEYSEQPVPDRAMTIGFEPVEPEGRKDHHTISTETYYQAEQSGFGDDGYENTQDCETDGDTGFM